MKKQAFQPGTVSLPVAQLFPMFTRKSLGGKGVVYRRIVSSIREVGLIEPIVVVEKEGRYFIKDGYLRWKALTELKIDNAECLIGTDDDAYTYNKRVNPLSTTEAHAMINKAISSGVSIDKIASTLNVQKSWVKTMDTLLVGIAPSIVGMLKQGNATKAVYEELKKVTQTRQIEIVELLHAANDYSKRYTRVLVLATPENQRMNNDIAKKKVDEEQQRILAGKLHHMEMEFKRAFSGFREKVFDLVKLSGYLRLVINNGKARAFLERNYPDILVTFEKIVKDLALDV